MSTPLSSKYIHAGVASTWQERPLDGPASAFVEATWVGRGGVGRSIRLLPDGCLDLVFDGRRLWAFLPQPKAIRRRVDARTLNVGLRLRCGAAGLVLGCAPERLQGPQALLAPLWGELATDAETRLRRVRDLEARREILVQLVSARLGDLRTTGAPLQGPIALLRDAFGTVEAVARGEGVMPRSLRQAFERHVGLSPKQLQRVYRFRRLLLALPRLASHHRAGAVVAAELGYFDQAHMIRDCRAITGSTPTALAARV